MVNFASSIQRLPPTALDPDHLEQQFASQLHGAEGAYQLPFLQAAMYDRQRRGQMLSDQNQRANEQAGQLAQQEMNMTERGQLRTLAGTGYAHGVPADPNLMMVGGMPTPESATRVAQLGAHQVMQESDAQAAQSFGTGAFHALEGGVSPNALPGMGGMARETPLRVQTAGIGAAGHGAPRYTERVDAEGHRTSEVQGRDPAQIRAAGDQLQQNIQGQNQQRAANVMIGQHPPLRDALSRARAATEAAGGRITGITADPGGNTVTLHAERNGQQVSRTFNRSGAPVNQ